MTFFNGLSSVPIKKKNKHKKPQNNQTCISDIFFLNPLSDVAGPVQENTIFSGSWMPGLNRFWISVKYHKTAT